MGGRRLAITDPDKIVDDWPEKGAVGRERRKQEYREQRRALKAEKPAEPVREFRFPLPPPEEYFPEWDWVLEPWGPPLDDPKCKAYIDIQWRAMLKHSGVRKNA